MDTLSLFIKNFSSAAGIPLGMLAVVEHKTMILAFLGGFFLALIILLTLRKRIWSIILVFDYKLDSYAGKVLAVVLIVGLIFWILSLA